MPVSIFSTEVAVWSLLQEIVPFLLSCLLLGLNLSVSVSGGLFSCLLFCWLSWQAGIVLPQQTPPAQSLGVTEGILSFPQAAVGAFRSTEMSSQWERCLQHSVNITISHFRRCHSMSSFHFLIEDRSIHESLWCKVSSSYRSAVHMLQARNNGYLYGSLRREEGFFDVKWKWFTLHNVSTSQVK